MKIKRRAFIAWTAALGLAPWEPSSATPDEAAQAIRQIAGSSLIKNGRVTLQIPPLVENGNLVVLKVTVDSPMTPEDYVKAIHIVAEGNPLPNVISFYLGPRCGRADITTRVRLGDSQRIWAVAHMSNGLFFQGYAETLVTASACTENLS